MHFKNVRLNQDHSNQFRNRQGALLGYCQILLQFGNYYNELVAAGAGTVSTSRTLDFKR